MKTIQGPDVNDFVSDDLMFTLEQPEKIDLKSASNSLDFSQDNLSNSLRVSIDQTSINIQDHSKDQIIVTNLEYIPGHRIKRYVGRISHHFIREAKENKENKESSQLSGKNKLGNLSCVFLREAISIARAHVIGMGGDALIGFSIDSFVLVARSGYCLISFSGDAVLIRK